MGEIGIVNIGERRMSSVLDILSLRGLWDAQVTVPNRQKCQFICLQKDLNLKYKFVSYRCEWSR